ncbi:MAG: AIR synthase family protein, partial [Acidobacteria bacterium]|nr:AIR synthase family protein [Acidobacteriota bacterium]
DAAVLDMGERCLVVSTDPVTFAADHIGWYAVHVNANDVAVMGARPRWFFPVLLLPEGAATDAMVAGIMREIADACEALDATVCGGHTEITTGLTRPVVIGQMLGEVSRQGLVQKAGLRVGDHVLLTGGVAIEGTALLAREMAGLLRDRVPDPVLARGREFLTDPGISVVRAALIAAEVGGVHAMHDPTEGGVLTGLHELAAASGLGLRVYGDRIPVYAETTAVCEVLGIDPLGLIASGALLIGAPASACEGVVAALDAARITVTLVGEVVPADEGVTIEREGVRRTLVPPERDELARVFDTRGRSPRLP